MPPRPPVILTLLALLGSLALGADVGARRTTLYAGYAVGRVASPVATAVPSAPLPLEGERHDALAAFVRDAVAKLAVPGAAVAVVQGGEVVFLEGYGNRELGGTAPVGPNTLFEVGSITKPFTSVLAGALVDDGLLAWDTPAADLLPGLDVANAALVERLTVADLFCACSGLPARDEVVFWNADRLDPPRLIASLAAIAPTAPPGERFQYSNHAYAVAGYGAALAAGADPGDLLAGYRLALRQRVLGPIGMARSTFALDEVLADGDFALPHAYEPDGRAVTLQLLRQQRPLAALDPAAGLWSSAREQARWLQTLLAGGVAPSGARVVTADGLERLWQGRVALPPGLALGGFRGYGLGWFVGDIAGHRLVGHSGSTPGFAAELALLPEANLGIAVLTNGGAGGAALAFTVQQRLFEVLLGLPPAAEAQVARSAAEVTAAAAAAPALLGTVDAAAVTPFLGRYANSDLGEATLEMWDSRLVLDAGEIRGELVPLRTRPDPDVRYTLMQGGAAGIPAQVVPRRDRAGHPELVVRLVPPPSLHLAEIGEPPTYVFSAVATTSR